MHSHIYLTYLPVCVCVFVCTGSFRGILWGGSTQEPSLAWTPYRTCEPGSDLKPCFGQGSLQRRVVSVRSVTVFTVLIVVVVVVVYLCVVVGVLCGGIIMVVSPAGLLAMQSHDDHMTT